MNSGENVGRIMWSVSLALLPAVIGAVYFFGIGVLRIIGVTILAAVATEAVILALRKKPVSISDGSAFLTGLLLAMNLPQDVPLWLPVLGAVFAIGVVKQVFGGLGHNIFNPALGGRVFLVLAYSKYMTTKWAIPRCGVISIDGVTSATPLTAWFEANRALSDPQIAEGARALASRHIQALYSPDSLLRLFTGDVGGCIGETSVLLLVIGAIFLFVKRYISWHIPVSFLGALAVFTWVLWIPDVSQPFHGNVLFHVFSGGAVLGAFFMATDMVTSPVTRKGKVIFGIGCGMLTALIRLYASYPEGVSFAILLMNAATPMIDRHVKPRRYGKSTVVSD
jgi:electron transport complex protein RnfD